MPTAVGPNTKGEENLVFGYDLGDVSNSYKGEPTTNVYTTLGFSFYQAEGGHTAVRTLGPAPFLNLPSNYDYHTITTDASWISESKRLILWPASLPTSTTYRVSFWARVTSTSTAEIGAAFYGSNINNGLILTSEWQRFNFSSTTHPLYPALEFGSKDGAIVFQVAGLQIESKSHATPYVNTTRSATQGLLDLTGNSTIDLTNVSFDSNAQMTFDGTNDYADLGSYLTNLDTSTISFEIVFKSNISTGDVQNLIGWMTNETPHGYICTGNFTGYWGNESISFFNYSSGGVGHELSFAYTNGHAFLNDQNYHHVVFTLQSADYRIYVDGVEVAVNPSFRNGSSSSPMTSNLFGYGSTPSVEIGAGSNPAYYANATVPLVKIYNRVLTASEIKSNYNAVKGRFNI